MPPRPVYRVQRLLRGAVDRVGQMLAVNAIYGTSVGWVIFNLKDLHRDLVIFDHVARQRVLYFCNQYKQYDISLTEEDLYQLNNRGRMGLLKRVHDILSREALEDADNGRVLYPARDYPVPYSADNPRPPAEYSLEHRQCTRDLPPRRPSWRFFLRRF